MVLIQIQKLGQYKRCSKITITNTFMWKVHIFNAEQISRITTQSLELFWNTPTLEKAQMIIYSEVRVRFQVDPVSIEDWAILLN